MRNLFFLFVLIAISACGSRELKPEIQVYFNDFDTNDFVGISEVNISTFDGDLVMGNYNNSGFDLTLSSLPEHDNIRVTFDLYIHDSWEGNANERFQPGEDHDAWILEFDRDEKVKSAEKIHFETTFSNGLCIPAFCHAQSYPREFPFPNNARMDATNRTLPGLCAWLTTPNGTSVYEIDLIFPHSRTNTVLSFYDRLLQPESFDPKCDESWSLDDLSISVF